MVSAQTMRSKTKSGISNAVSKKGAKIAMPVQEEVNENLANLRKEKMLAKQANKDPNFLRRLIIKRINKDAARSNLFRESVIRRKNAKDQTGEDVKDSDEEEEKENDAAGKVDEEDNIDDDYLDLEFVCATEILRSKKSAL